MKKVLSLLILIGLFAAFALPQVASGQVGLYPRTGTLLATTNVGVGVRSNLTKDVYLLKGRGINLYAEVGNTSAWSLAFQVSPDGTIWPTANLTGSGSSAGAVAVGDGAHFIWNFCASNAAATPTNIVIYTNIQNSVLDNFKTLRLLYASNICAVNKTNLKVTYSYYP